MVDASIITAVASAVLAGVAVLFAIVQMVVALSQYLGSMNRCAQKRNWRVQSSTRHLLEQHYPYAQPSLPHARAHNAWLT